jgi:hypothetical protein
MRRLLALVALALSSCMPFALPPARLSLGTGPSAGTVTRPDDVALHAKQVTGFRAGLHPLSMLDHASSRSFDAGVGYGVDFITGSERPTQPAGQRDSHDLSHGPYLEGAYYPLRGRLSDATYLRFGGRGDVDLLFLEPDDRVGVGGTGVAELELATDVSGPFVSADSDGVVLGTQRGQWALGVFAGGTLRNFRDASYGGFTGGVSIRMPLAAGMICCAWSHGSSRDPEPDEQRHRSRAKPRRLEH